MGCSESKSVESGDSGKEKTAASKQPVNNGTSKKQSGGEEITLKDYYESILNESSKDGETYIQPAIPDHYMKEEVNLDNKDTESDSWENIKVKLLPQQSANSSRKEKLMWKRPANKKYVCPDDVMCEEISLDVKDSKRQFIALGNFYLGGASGLVNLEEVIERIDIEQVHSVVLTGNLIEQQALNPLHELPNDLSQSEEMLNKLQTALTSLRTLSEKVKVYYLKGSHDCDLPRAAVDKLLGEHIVQVQQDTLLLVVSSGSDICRLCFTSGRQWDFFNRVLPNDKLLSERPIGYYITRAGIQNGSFSVSNLLRTHTNRIPKSSAAEFLKELSKTPLQDRLTEVILMSAFNNKDKDQVQQYKCVVGPGKYISTETVVGYPYLKHYIEEVGVESIAEMLYAITGDYETIAKKSSEDVLISGLGDSCSVRKMAATSGHMIVTCTGSCSGKSEQNTMVRVTLPMQLGHGQVEIVNLTSEEVKETINTENAQRDEEKNQDDNISVESL